MKLCARARKSTKAIAFFIKHDQSIPQQCWFSALCRSSVRSHKMVDICIFVLSLLKPAQHYQQIDTCVCIYSMCERIDYLLYCVCICGLLLEKGLQVSNLIEIIPLKWTLLQHSCSVNPILCIQSIYTIQNTKGLRKKRTWTFFSGFKLCIFIVEFMVQHLYKKRQIAKAIGNFNRCYP